MTADRTVAVEREIDIVDRLRSASTIASAPEFAPKDRKPGDVPALLWEAAEEIERQRIKIGGMQRLIGAANSPQDQSFAEITRQL